MQQRNKIKGAGLEEILNIRWLPMQDYNTCWQAMRKFTDERNEETLDEIWLLEHPPVFTQGQNGKKEHILNPGNIPIIQTDRGGQITYHGPGQLIIYTLIDLKRKKFNIREYVGLLEQSLINLLAEYDIEANAKCEAPGVYVNDEKIASIGLRVRRGCTYHGIAFNIQMDLQPFTRINPCGYTALRMTQFSSIGGLNTVFESGQQLIKYLMKNLRYNHCNLI